MWVMSESGVLFQILTHDSYEQTNSIQLEFFFLYKSFAGNTTANPRIPYHAPQRS